MKLKGSQIVVRTLIEQGCEVVFGYPGAAVIDIFDALYEYRDEIRFVLCADEQGAVHAADGFARATGKVGVCLSTSGPGATNLVTGIAAAHLDSVPLVIVCGNVSSANIATDAFQEIDITGITLPITKHNYFVADTTILAHTIRKAFHIASSGRPGPVLVDITKDTQERSVDWEPMPHVMPERQPVLATEEELDAAAAAINACKRPFIYFGGGAIASNAEDEIAYLADLIDSPMGCSLMGVSGIATDNPRFLGMAGMHGHIASTICLRESDVLIALGVRFNDRSTGERSRFKCGETIVHIDADTSELSKNTRDTFMLTGDLKLTLQRLLPKLERRTRTSWSEYVAGMRVREDQGIERKPGLNPRSAMLALNDHLDQDTYVVTDVGQHQMWAAQYLNFKRPRTFITNGGLGAMGFGLGAAIGCSMATGKRTVLVTGDGGFQMCATELATAVGEHLPLTILVMDNQVLGMVRQWQTLFYDRHYAGTSLNMRRCDYVALASAYGAHGKRVETIEELKAAFDEAFASDEVYLIDCAIDSDELVLPMMQPNGSLQDIMERV